MGKKAAVIFDLDDTLYPSNQFVRGGIAAASEVLERMTGIDVDPVPVLMAILQKEGPFHLFDRGFSKMGIKQTPELMSELVRAFRSHSPELSPYPGMTGLLYDLRTRGVATAVVTDGHADVQRKKWEALDLSYLFDIVVFCRDLNGLDCPKPAPAPFAAAATALGNISPCVFVGDNPSADFPAPDSFGWDTVRVCWPDGTHITDGDVCPRRTIVKDIDSLMSVLFEKTGV